MRIKKIYFLLFVFMFSVLMLALINFYLDNSLTNSQEKLDSSQEILILINAQDSILYQILLTEDISQVTLLEDISIQQTQFLEVFSKLFSSDMQEGTPVETNFQRYLELELIKQEIITLHRLHLVSSVENYDVELRSLLTEYNDLSSKIAEDFQGSIELLKIELEEFRKNVFNLFLIFFIYTLFLIYLSILFFSKEKNSVVENKYNDQIIYDSISKEILNYVDNLNKKEKYPTIKDVKSKFNLTHPTVLSKINLLEENKNLKIIKKGRNKHLFFIKF